MKLEPSQSKPDDGLLSQPSYVEGRQQQPSKPDDGPPASPCEDQQSERQKPTGAGCPQQLMEGGPLSHLTRSDLLSDLPPEVLLNILGQLDRKSLIAVWQVNRILHATRHTVASTNLRRQMQTKMRQQLCCCVTTDSTLYCRCVNSFLDMCPWEVGGTTGLRLFSSARLHLGLSFWENPTRLDMADRTYLNRCHTLGVSEDGYVFVADLDQLAVLVLDRVSLKLVKTLSLDSSVADTSLDLKRQMVIEAAGEVLALGYYRRCVASCGLDDHTAFVVSLYSLKAGRVEHTGDISCIGGQLARIHGRQKEDCGGGDYTVGRAHLALSGDGRYLAYLSHNAYHCGGHEEEEEEEEEARSDLLLYDTADRRLAAYLKVPPTTREAGAAGGSSTAHVNIDQMLLKMIGRYAAILYVTRTNKLRLRLADLEPVRRASRERERGVGSRPPPPPPPLELTASTVKIGGLSRLNAAKAHCEPHTLLVSLSAALGGGRDTDSKFVVALRHYKRSHGSHASLFHESLVTVGFSLDLGRLVAGASIRIDRPTYTKVRALRADNVLFAGGGGGLLAAALKGPSGFGGRPPHEFVLVDAGGRVTRLTMEAGCSSLPFAVKFDRLGAVVLEYDGSVCNDIALVRSLGYARRPGDDGFLLPSC